MLYGANLTATPISLTAIGADCLYHYTATPDVATQLLPQEYLLCQSSEPLGFLRLQLT